MDYPGALGVMEMCKFYNLATDDQIALMKSLISNKKLKEAWELLTGTVGTSMKLPKMSLKEFLSIEKNFNECAKKKKVKKKNVVL